MTELGMAREVTRGSERLSNMSKATQQAAAEPRPELFPLNGGWVMIRQGNSQGNLYSIPKFWFPQPLLM